MIIAMKPERKTHLVLGGAGFIGSHLCDALVALGDAVVCYDNLTTGRKENIEGARRAGLWSSQRPDISTSQSRRRFDFVRGDVRDQSRLGWNGATFLHGKFDIIWNLACPASPPAYQQDPIGTLMTCVVGTKNALELAHLSGPHTVVVQASTSEVYGDPLEHPQAESYRGNVNPHGPRACYDEGKRAAEALCFDFMRCHGVDVRVARIFNTYGPRMRADDGRVVSNFIVQALCGEKLTMYGDGLQTRSFCHVNDLVRGLLSMGLARSSGASKPLFDAPVNLGNPSECTLMDLARDILDLTGRLQRPVGQGNESLGGTLEEQIEHRTLPVDDPCRRKPDISRARSIIGWEPMIERRDGLALTISHFKQELGL
jgi:UDP-glucuronate decarboxylase